MTITHRLAPSIRDSIDERVEVASTMPDIFSRKRPICQPIFPGLNERLVRFVAYSGVPVRVTWLAH